MRIPLYQVDAFASRLFSGNPAAVCPLAEWLPDELMQQIAAENNLAETAFYVPAGDAFHIRWFTPAVEVDLCGHATLAAAHVLFTHEGYAGTRVQFQSRSGVLTVTKQDTHYTLDFPVDTLSKTETAAVLVEALGAVPLETWKGKTDHLLVFGSQNDIVQLQPDFKALARFSGRGIIVTARGEDCDFVSRFFAPQSGIDEDPVTGSAHTSLTPYWAARLKKTEFTTRQLSKRGGELSCRLEGERVLISGQAITYSEGMITV